MDKLFFITIYELSFEYIEKLLKLNNIEINKEKEINDENYIKNRYEATILFFKAGLLSFNLNKEEEYLKDDIIYDKYLKNNEIEDFLPDSSIILSEEFKNFYMSSLDYSYSQFSIVRYFILSDSDHILNYFDRYEDESDEDFNETDEDMVKYEKYEEEALNDKEFSDICKLLVINKDQYKYDDEYKYEIIGIKLVDKKHLEDGYEKHLQDLFKDIKNNNPEEKDILIIPIDGIYSGDINFAYSIVKVEKKDCCQKDYTFLFSFYQNPPTTLELLALYKTYNDKYLNSFYKSAARKPIRKRIVFEVDDFEYNIRAAFCHTPYFRPNPYIKGEKFSKIREGVFEVKFI